ncbi:MAG: hypothetical protein ACI93R_001131 [Flavobacteriales bacterium]
MAKPRNQQITAIALAIVFVLMILGSLAWAWVDAAFTPKSTRDFLYVPFDEYDATLVCNQEMHRRLGDQLLRSYVDKHSTRLDAKTGVYRIYLRADTGTQDSHKEVTVYCFVDKWNFKVSHYKEMDADNREILTSELKFFGS